MPQNRSKTSVRLEDLCFYFDAVERDRLDAAGTSRRSGEVLALRQKLLKLPDEAFDAAIKTIHSLADDKGAREGNASDPERRRRAGVLYDQTRPAQASGAGVGKIAPT